MSPGVRVNYLNKINTFCHLGPVQLFKANLSLTTILKKIVKIDFNPFLSKLQLIGNFAIFS